MQADAPFATARDPQTLKAILDPWRESGDRIAFVPTMGALHEGHLSLVRTARANAERVVVSIFVNPRQFGPTEDFSTYPRDEAGDLAALAAEGVDAIYLPTTAVMYPEGYQTVVSVPALAAPLDGASRPGFFDGVATVVAKLFLQVRPDAAVFGQKDYQQLLVIRQMVADLHLGVEVIGAPIVREADGLAMSSRNRYLSADERKTAGHLNHILRSTLARLAEGEPVGSALGHARDDLDAVGLAPIDYLELRRLPDLAPVTEGVLGAEELGETRLFAAVMLGRTRLIDNMGLGG